jgi:acid phosphatase type 7
VLAVAASTSAGPGAAAPTARAIADAHVSAAAPARNFGRARTLKAGPGARSRTYLRFRVPALGRAVAKASLQLYVVRGGGRVSFHPVAATWPERRVTFRRAPALGRAAATAGVPRPGRWASFDVTPLVRRAGTITIGLSATRPVAFSSREAGRAARLELTAAAEDEVVVLAAGDIADCASQGDEATARLLDAQPGTVLLLGDIAYPSGRPQDFACYHASWGRFKARTRPSPGNHEYLTRDASGYFDYFGAAAGARGKGYYSFDEGAWHLIAVNSNCSRVGGCGPRSPQEQWLRADLAATSKRCTLAFWHHPLFSSGRHGAHASMRPIWQALYDAGAELVLVGHDHFYERFAPQTPAGTADSARGIRQFMVGTGGKNHTRVRTPVRNSEVRNDDTFGVLKLRLSPGGYRWQFLPEAGKTFSDAGAGSCR